ncbi:glycoside hydrolase family 43 protein [Sandaracinus amylolyticus]|uniref:glycoside hydrolase family 43 protein n=1 Tax=Sandaracinus amylolyticus TaxID=927083 RepID=UPI001F1A7F39|nr:glycoside hydrolase family 43 protein [Sandaracinus amylolyticus]
MDAGEADAGPPPAPCSTRITYGSAWIRGERTTDFDVVRADVRWDGVCTNEGSNSYAVLSNGWRPYFTGHNACVIALDHTGCPNTDAACTTRITYGESWIAPAGRTSRTDRVTGRVTWNGGCRNRGAESYATLSNGWTPTFRGNNACNIGFAYSECGGLYTNAVITSCADPGVMEVDGTYYASCTGGGPSGGAFALFTSRDLVHWESIGRIFPAGHVPSWARDRFWAPEPHRVGDHYVTYFSAGDHSGRMGIGAAYADDPAGPYTDIGAPFIYDARISLIDASYFEDTSGQGYVMWKTDGNAQNEPTVVYAQRVSRDGLTRIGSPVELLRNDLAWEGRVVEGSWIIYHDGYYYLFYSGNAYYNDTYGVGVARATSPLGPYQKRGDPIVSTNDRWIGPGHCSVVEGPSGDWQMVYHAWQAGQVGSGWTRRGMTDPVHFADGWPVLREVPSTRSIPLP